VLAGLERVAGGTHAHGLLATTAQIARVTATVSVELATFHLLAVNAGLLVCGASLTLVACGAEILVHEA
jgi:hypothetical protein